MDDVLVWRGEIVLKNFLFVFGKKDYSNYAYLHVSGHSHDEKTMKTFLFEKKENVFALSHLWYSTKENVNNGLFACCSCHNQCLRRYNGLEYIKDIQAIRNQQVANNDERKRIFF